MAITKPNQVSIAVVRVTDRTSDGAGGYNPTESAVTGSPFAGRLIRKAAIRTGAMIDAPQGRVALDEIVLAFPAGSDIRDGDVCTVDDVAYTVQVVRTYSRSVQADVVAVH